MLTSLRAAMILLLGIPSILAAEPIHVSGRLQTLTEPTQRIAGARVDLLPQTGETPLATARTDAGGVFELTAPESGCFRVRMRADGYVSVEALLLPLVEDLDLTPAPAFPGPDGQVTSGSPVGAEWIFGARSPAAARPSGAPPRLVQGKVRDLKGAPVAGALVWSEGDPDVSCVKSGADGGFQIRLPAQGETKLRATATGFFPSDSRQAPPPGRQGPPLVLTLTPAGAIAGRVVDAAGQPLARVQVIAKPFQWASASPREGRALSRADGRFRLSPVSPGTLHEVTATLDGFAPSSVKADALSSPRPVRIVMERGATVLGKVLDPEGQPVPGVQLELWTYRNDESSQRILDASVGKAVSDPAGSFAIPHLGAGRFELRVVRYGFVTLSVPEIEVPDRTARVDLGPLTLARGSVIEGRVTDPAGVPLPGANVSLTKIPDPLDPGAAVSWLSLDYSIAELTDAEGRFRFEDLRRGARFDLRVERPGFLPATVPSVAAPTVEPLRIEIKMGRSVAGQVKSPEGRPVPKARVLLRADPRTGLSSQGTTDEDGRFRLAGIPPGVVALAVDAPGYPEARVEDLRIPEESDVEGLEIDLHQGNVLEVQVLDSRRRPVAGAWVGAFLRNSGTWEVGGHPSCQTDPEGRCRLEEVDVGRYDVTAYSEKLGQARDAVEIGPGINRHELVLPSAERVSPSGGTVTVSGRVSDETGAPVAGAALALRSPESGLFFQATSLTDGSFQFSAVRDGTYRLGGNAPGFFLAAAMPEVQVAGQEVRGLMLRLSRGATLTGRVLGLNPEELANVSIHASLGQSIQADMPSMALDSHADWEGRYKLAGLAPGEWSISAQARGRAIQERLQIAPGARDAVLDLRFPSGYTLTGRVTADGAPLAGARISASSVSGSFQGVAGPDGVFQISNIPPGSYSVWASGGPMLRTSATVEVTGDQEVNLDLTTGGLGVVVLAGGAPVANASVRLEDAFLPGGPSWPTDAAGRPAIPRLTPGAYRVYVQKGGFEPARVNVEVRPGAVIPVEIELKPLQ